MESLLLYKRFPLFSSGREVSCDKILRKAIVTVTARAGHGQYYTVVSQENMFANFIKNISSTYIATACRASIHKFTTILYRSQESSWEVKKIYR